MADSFEWKITKLHRYVDSGVVYSADWVLAGTRAPDVQASIVGSTGFKTTDPNDPRFIAYADLNENEVIEWVKAELISIDANKVQLLEAELTGNLDEIEWPTKKQGTPWPTSPKPDDGNEYIWNTDDSCWEIIQKEPFVIPEPILQSNDYSSPPSQGTV